MSARVAIRRMLGIGCSVMLTVTGCSFNGLNSLPLPGATGRGPGASIYHVEVANVGTLEANSPVMVDDVIVGSISKMTVQGWHANLDISVKPGVSIPANVIARVGQTSLLGSMHLRAESPAGRAGDRTATTGRHHPAEPVGDLSVDRADVVLVVGDPQRRRTGPIR